MNKQLLRLPEVMLKCGLAKTEIYSRMAEGRFPKSVHLGPRCVAWVEKEIDAWIDERIAERDSRNQPAGRREAVG